MPCLVYFYNKILNRHELTIEISQKTHRKGHRGTMAISLTRGIARYLRDDIKEEILAMLGWMDSSKDLDGMFSPF